MLSLDTLSIYVGVYPVLSITDIGWIVNHNTLSCNIAICFDAWVLEVNNDE